MSKECNFSRQDRLSYEGFSLQKSIIYLLVIINFTCTVYFYSLQSVFSRIARVCKSDRGGPHKFRSKWTTFLKSRLNCSVPGDTPFYFNDIQATTNFIEDGSEQVLYGVFTTPDNSIGKLNSYYGY